MADEYLSHRAFSVLVKRSNVYISRLVKEGKLPANADGKIPKAAGLVAFAASQTVGYDANRAHAEKQRAASKKVAASPAVKTKAPAKDTQSNAALGRAAIKTAPTQPPLELPDEDSDGAPLSSAPAARGAPSITEAQVAAQFNKARTAEKMFQAKLRELEFKERQGDLLAIAEVEADAQAVAGELMDKLRSIAPRIAAMCEGRPAREIEGVIDAAVNDALGALHKSRFARDALKGG